MRVCDFSMSIDSLYTTYMGDVDYSKAKGNATYLELKEIHKKRSKA
jgi:hypothetical protein